MLEIALLGRFDVRLNGERLPIKSRPLQKIAAYLALHSGQSIARTKLAGTLWPDFRVIKVNLNTQRPPFDNGRIRRALALATDRHLIAETAARGLGTPATGGYIPLGMPGHRPDLALPYDLQQAKRLLAEEGFPDGQGLPPTPTLLRIFTVGARR